MKSFDEWLEQKTAVNVDQPSLPNFKSGQQRLKSRYSSIQTNQKDEKKNKDNLDGGHKLVYRDTLTDELWNLFLQHKNKPALADLVSKYNSYSDINATGPINWNLDNFKEDIPEVLEILNSYGVDIQKFTPLLRA